MEIPYSPGGASFMSEGISEGISEDMSGQFDLAEEVASASAVGSVASEAYSYGADSFEQSLSASVNSRSGRTATDASYGDDSFASASAASANRSATVSEAFSYANDASASEAVSYGDDSFASASEAVSYGDDSFASASVALTDRSVSAASAGTAGGEAAERRPGAGLTKVGLAWWTHDLTAAERRLAVAKLSQLRLAAEATVAGAGGAGVARVLRAIGGRVLGRARREDLVAAARECVESGRDGELLSWVVAFVAVVPPQAAGPAAAAGGGAVGTMPVGLAADEQDLLAAAFRNEVASRLATWRTIRGMFLAARRKAIGAEELRRRCNSILSILEDTILGDEAEPDEASLDFAEGLRGQCLACITEVAAAVAAPEPMGGVGMPLPPWGRTVLTVGQVC